MGSSGGSSDVLNPFFLAAGRRAVGGDANGNTVKKSLRLDPVVAIVENGPHERRNQVALVSSDRCKVERFAAAASGKSEAAEAPGLDVTASISLAEP